MSAYAFRVAVAVLLLTMFALLSVIGSRNSDALANRPQQTTQQSDRTRRATEMIDTVTRRGDRMYELCSYLSTVAGQIGMQHLTPRSACEGMRSNQIDATARWNGVLRNGITDEGLIVLSRATDQFMIETAPHLRTMEESYATVSREMRAVRR